MMHQNDKLVLILTLNTMESSDKKYEFSRSLLMAGINALSEKSRAEHPRQNLNEIWEDFHKNGSENNNEEEPKEIYKRRTSTPINAEHLISNYFSALDINNNNISNCDDFKKNNNNNNNHNSGYKEKKSKKSLKKCSKKEKLMDYCVFCKNNNEPMEVVLTHATRDHYGRVTCPRLRDYVCPLCKETGDQAHTLKYCPKKPLITEEQTILRERMKSLQLNRKYRIPRLTAYEHAFLD